MVARCAPEVHTLLPVIDDLVALHVGPGLHAGQVGALVRLGESLAVHVLAGDDPRQEVRALLGGAVHDDRRADQGLAHAAPYPWQPGLVELLVQHREPDAVHALAAELLRPLRADQPGVGEPALPLRVLRLRGRPGQFGALVPAGRRRDGPVGQPGKTVRGAGRDPLAEFGPELRDLRAEVEIHDEPPGGVGSGSGSGSGRVGQGQILESNSKFDHNKALVALSRLADSLFAGRTGSRLGRTSSRRFARRSPPPGARRHTTEFHDRGHF